MGIKEHGMDANVFYKKDYNYCYGEYHRPLFLSKDINFLKEAGLKLEHGGYVRCPMELVTDRSFGGDELKLFFVLQKVFKVVQEGRLKKKYLVSYKEFTKIARAYYPNGMLTNEKYRRLIETLKTRKLLLSDGDWKFKLIKMTIKKEEKASVQLMDFIDHFLLLMLCRVSAQALKTYFLLQTFSCHDKPRCENQKIETDKGSEMEEWYISDKENNGKYLNELKKAGFLRIDSSNNVGEKTLEFSMECYVKWAREKSNMLFKMFPQLVNGFAVDVELRKEDWVFNFIPYKQASSSKCREGAEYNVIKEKVPVKEDEVGDHNIVEMGLAEESDFDMEEA